MPVHQVELNNGVTIPQLGFGVFQVPRQDTEGVVLQAFEAGYRHIDTARIYSNERAVGNAFAASGLPRDEVFITTKLWNDDQGSESTIAAFETSMSRLGLDVLDLYLIHWPCPTKDAIVETWQALETLYSEGRIRAIGVSNFRPEDLQRLIDLGLTVPTVNQIELHPQLSQTELRAFHDDHQIVTEAWSPLAQGAVLGDDVIVEIADKHGATPAQIVIAWHLALGNVVIPKSVTPSRMAENFAASEILLDATEIAAIDALNRDVRIGPNPAEFG